MCSRTHSITPRTLYAVLCEQLDVDAILKAVDKDCDGRINYEEFCNYLCQNDAVSCLHNRRDSVLGLK